MDELRAAIDAAADPAEAAALARYFQTGPGGYGEGDVFVGVRLSVLRRLIRPYARRPFVAGEWLPMLDSPVHEHRLATLVVMSERPTAVTRPKVRRSTAVTWSTSRRWTTGIWSTSARRPSSAVT